MKADTAQRSAGLVPVCACGSDAVEPGLLKPGQPGFGTHYARLICRACNKFNGWGRDPRVTDAAVARLKEIDTILAAGRATPWERQFLQSIARQRHLTDKQQAIWTKIQGESGR